ncbi:MAG TPA: hypothetical protein PL060_03610 [bacterium]|nr:hypothetical protein [bacterium]
MLASKKKIAKLRNVFIEIILYQVPDIDKPKEKKLMLFHNHQ